MKTLIIHPEDPSTWFLNILYAPLLPEATLVTQGSKEEVRRLIESHDRVMMMGHGSPQGLFSVGRFREQRRSGFVVDDSMVELLREKNDNVFIWCHASDFVAKHGLTGFACGMFISEVGEAMWCDVKGADQRMVDESNFLFMREAAQVITSSAQDLHQRTTQGEYGKLATVNPVARYNHSRLRLY